MEAYAKIGEYNYDMGNYSVALSNFESCLLVYNQYNDGRILYPAMSAYHVGEISSVDYYAMTPVNNQNVEFKTQLFNGAVANYNRTFSYLDDDYVFRAVLKIGQLQEDFANSIGFMDLPPEVTTPEGEEAFYNVLMEAYDTYIQRAMTTYENGLQLAVSNGIKTEYTDTIATNLDLLLPGSSIDLGYTEPVVVIEDSTGTLDSLGTPVDVQPPVEDSGSPDDSQLPETDTTEGTDIEPVIYEEEEEYV